MSRARRQRGGSSLETLVAAAILSLSMTAIGGMLIQTSRVNKGQQLVVAAQSDARTCLGMITAKLRTSGWDPTSAGLQTVALDATPGDGIDEIESFADLDADGDTDGVDEQVLIRHVADRIEWRRSAAGAFEVLATGISNDADGDGTVEPMFTADSATDPTRIEVRITAESPSPIPGAVDPIRVTMSSVVVLRKSL